MATDYSDYSLKQLTALRRQLAKRANQRMVELEHADVSKNANATIRAANAYLERQGRMRFSERKTAIPVTNPYKETKAGTRLKTEAEIRAEQRRKEISELGQLEKFLAPNAPTTVFRINQRRKKARETFKKNFGVDFDDETIDMLFEVDAFEWIRRTYGSDTMNDLAKSINEGQSTKEEVISKVNQIRLRYESATNRKEKSRIENYSPESLFSELGLEWKPEYRQQRRM